MNYYSAQILLVLGISLTMLMIIYMNDNIGVKVRKRFVTTFIFIMVGVTCEFVAPKFYYVYTLVFILTSIYMICNACSFWRQHKEKNTLEMCSIVCFAIIGLAIQMFNPEIKSCWVTVAIDSMLFYMHYNGVILHIDSLTDLLNKRSYHSYMEYCAKKTFALIILDVNEFKIINDMYGHLFGDNVLAVMAKIIKQTYGKHGKCYRIGGDEFAVIIPEKAIHRLQEMSNQLEFNIQEEKNKLPELPTISYGWSIHKPGRDSIKKTIEDADKEMYENKKKSR